MRKQMILMAAFWLLIPIWGYSQSSNWLSTINLNVSDDWYGLSGNSKTPLGV